MEKWEVLVQSALERYSLSDPVAEFIRHNENLTCKLTDKATSEQYVLRVHMPKEGFSRETAQHSFESLLSELKFIAAVGEHTDVAVQTPSTDCDNQLVTTINEPETGEEIHATLLTWIDGKPMHHEDPDWEQRAYQTGVMVAKLHNFAASWEEGKRLNRHTYDATKLNTVIDAMAKGRKTELITEQQFETLKQGAARIRQLMAELDLRSTEAKGLIHADLQKSNLIVHDNGVTPIDFCLCGHGYYYMDLGGISADFAPLNIRKALLQGYRTVRDLPESDIKYVEAFFVMTIMLFMATHRDNPNLREWFIRRMPVICSDYITPLINGESFYEKI